MKICLLVVTIVVYCCHHSDALTAYPNQCCDVGQEALATAAASKVLNDKSFSDCRNELSIPTDASARTDEQTACLQDCVARKLGILPSSGNAIDEAAWKTYVSTYQASTDFQKSQADDDATFCYNYVNSLDSSGLVVGSCTKIGMQAVYCVEKKLFLACPSDLQNTTGACTDKRTEVAALVASYA